MLFSQSLNLEIKDDRKMSIDLSTRFMTTSTVKYVDSCQQAIKLIITQLCIIFLVLLACFSSRVGEQLDASYFHSSFVC